MKVKSERRAFLRLLGLTGVGVMMGSMVKGAAFAIEACDKLDPSSPTDALVKALKYVPVSKTKGQKCESCMQFNVSGDNKKLGQCAIFQGCSVAANGWCASWSKKS